MSSANVQLSPRRVLVTGARGYVGRLLVQSLSALPADQVALVVASDLAATEPAFSLLPRVVYAAADICDRIRVEALLREHAIDVVVHLAAVVSPPPTMSHARIYEIDVGGTRNVLDAALATGVHKVVITSSGAAYGYHADNAPLLGEDAPLRGNDEFAYSRHKRLVEELLAEYRAKYPQLGQLIFRPGTVVGEGVHNQITALFEKAVVTGVTGAATPFVFVWDGDLVACLVQGVVTDKVGVYNVVGDGVMTLREIAVAMGKRFVALSPQALGLAMRVLRRAGLTQYGPEQVRFLQYRPVLSNERLKREFGFVPRKTSREAFEVYRTGGAAAVAVQRR